MPQKIHTDSFQEQYNSLNSEQRKAVDTIEGPLLVLAGPGTGKTQLLSVRAANIISKAKAQAEQILILTFTNAAARAMRHRLAQIIGHEGYNVEVETFHSFANSIVLESEEAIKYVKDKLEISEVEKVRAIEYILDNVKGVEALRPFGAPYIHRKEIEKRISELKNEGISPGEFKDSLKKIHLLKSDEDKHISRLKALASIYEKYERLKDLDCNILFDERGRRDYDDMILIANEALKTESRFRDIFRKRYKYIMVDEYQDTNGAQLELLFSILDPEKLNICCVGDDDQAIYRFQGATLSNFRILKEKLPMLKTVVLKDNYRSVEDIINISKRIISQIPEKERIAVKILESRKEYSEYNIDVKEFMTEEEELAFMVEEIRKQVDIIRKDKFIKPEEREKPLNNIAVLVRKRAHILKIIDAFLKAGIPYATDGEEDIRAEKRVRQVLNVLELAASDTKTGTAKALALYKVLTSDYIEAAHSDILRFIDFVNKKARRARLAEIKEDYPIDFFQQFQENFSYFKKDKNNEFAAPSEKESLILEISKKLNLRNPHALHRASWAITRLIIDAENKPVHDILMQYIEDVGLYRFILKRYREDEVLRIRDLRALVSFVNVVKSASLVNPALTLDDFIKELELRDVHGMPIQGELATLSQDGVRIYTAHKAKGLEFYTVFIPFCLGQKSWPLRRKPDIVPLPPEIYKSKERVEEKANMKLLDTYDELRLFYVASSRAKSNLIYTATPAEKVIISPFLGHLGLDIKSGSPEKEEDFLVKFLKLNKSRDQFSEGLDILKDTVSEMSLNPTSLNNYITCRRKFLYDNVLRLPGRKTQHIAFGDSAHKTLEKVYTLLKEKGVFPNFTVFKGIFEKELEYQGISDEAKGWCRDRLKTLSEWYRIESKGPVIPLALEKKLETILPKGVIFTGILDKIEEASKDELWVIDYKTGKPDEHIKAIANCTDLSGYECDDYYRQVVAYKLLYESQPYNKGKLITRGILQFLEPVSETVQKYGLVKGEYVKFPIELNDEMVKRLKEVIIECWENIQALRFEKLPERDDKVRCARCAYDSICWGDD